MPKQNRDYSPKAEREDKIEFEGTVLEALPSTLFKIRIDANTQNDAPTIIATLSGRMRQNRIRVLPGDRVKVEVSPYDLTRGRITWRGK